MNKILLSDAYKYTHWQLFPENTTNTYYYGESRGGNYAATVFFGLQGYIKEYLEGRFCTVEDVEEAKDFLFKVFGKNYFNYDGWMNIAKNGGMLPLRICAVPEGSLTEAKNPLFTVENTVSGFEWLPGFIETSLLRGVWYPTTVATQSYYIKKVIEGHCRDTGCSMSPFHLNDFGARGVSSHESASIGGAAHLLNFLGTDTIEGILWLMKNYHADVCGHSVMASEHSTTCIYQKSNELGAYTRFINQAPDDAILSMVMDSYDIENAVKQYICVDLKEKILSRSGKVVIRPDSGDPSQMALSVCKWLYHGFGGTKNSLGFIELNPKVGVIYGDSMDADSINDVLYILKLNGFASSNVIFGSGGGLLQKVNRDTCKFAMKMSSAVVDEKTVDVFKSPVTDPGKKSKAGRFNLPLVYENGTLLRDQTLDEIKSLLQNCG